MHHNHLLPRVAATLANQAYSLNSGNDADLKAFLNNPLFDQSATKSTLNASVGGRIFRAAEDAFGIAAPASGPLAGDLFLIFRGTTMANNKADVITDARIGLERSKTGAAVHIGFNHTFTSMIPAIHKYIGQNPIKGNIHCIGHSLGGAVATLAADWVHSNVTKKVKLYTFGQPRVGLTFFSQMVTRKLGAENIHRTFHTTDPVPMVPIFPYVHNPLPGLGHGIKSNNLIVSGEAHSMLGYVKSVKGKTWSELGRIVPVNNHETAIEEWLRSRRDEDASSSKTYEWVENAIFWLIKKTLSSVISVAQLAVMGVHTFIDKLAWALQKGLDLGEKVSGYVMLFLHKIMRILSIPKAAAGSRPTLSFFQYILRALSRRAYELAQRAIRSIK